MTNLIQLKPNTPSVTLKLEYLTTIIELINEVHKGGKRNLNKGVTQTINTEDGVSYEFTIKRKVKNG